MALPANVSVENHIKSIPSTMSFVLWRRKVPERIVTNPHNSVITCDGLCLSQSWKWISNFCYYPNIVEFCQNIRSRVVFSQQVLNILLWTNSKEAASSCMSQNSLKSHKYVACFLICHIGMFEILSLYPLKYFKY